MNGLLVTQMGLPPFIATLGMLGVARGLTFIVGGENAVYGLPSSFRLFGEGQIGPFPLPLLYLIVIAVAAYLILSRTKLGRYAYAIGSNEQAVRLSGIPAAPPSISCTHSCPRAVSQATLLPVQSGPNPIVTQ